MQCHSDSRTRHPAAGFTLLEMLVVIVVVGLLVGLFTLSIGSFSDDSSREELRRLNVLLTLAMEESAVQGRDLGLHFYQSGYEFSARLPRTDKDGLVTWEWQPLYDDRLLRPRNLGEDMRLELLLEDKPVILLRERNEREAYQPQIFLLSSGDLQPPFTVRLQQTFGSPVHELRAGADGEFEVIDDAI